MSRPTVFALLVLMSWGTTAVPAAALAQEAEADRLIEIMSRHLSQKREQQANFNRLKVNPISALRLQERTYREGESWTVARYTSGSAAMNARRAAIDGSAAGGQVAFFDFKVLAVAESGNVRIRVSPRDSGANPVDEQIDHVILVLNPSYILVEKQVFYRNGRHAEAIPMNRVENVALGFSVFPVDLPNLTSLEGKPVETLPEVPPALAPHAGSTFNQTMKKGLDFSTTDLYARPFQAIWNEGDPWPAYVRNATGISVLVR